MTTTTISANECDVLIIGAGLAGLSVALSLPKETRITVLAKDKLANCASNKAQGGIAAVMDEHDTFDSHADDTQIAGAGQCDMDSVRFIVEHAPEAIHWLSDLGVPFTRDQGRWHLTREGGHQYRRIVHAADHTGFSITQTLQKHLLAAPNITVLTPCHVEKLLVEDDRCYGAEIVLGDKPSLNLRAKKTVLATGGLGQLFSLTTNPSTAIGEGVALGVWAGCRVRHLAYVQFHPTALALPQNRGFLISEAVRGEGGILRNAAGKRFMPEYDSRAELAPRDIVARANYNEMTLSHSDCVYLDITHLPESFIQTHFPSILEECRQSGLDICHEWIPVAPAAHYSCGGILTNQQAHTDVTDLYAVGEVTCTGLHGANRLASNSLLECVVMGRAAAADMMTPSDGKWSVPKHFANTLVWHDCVQDISDDIDIKNDVPVSDLTQQIQHAMSAGFGIQRRFKSMKDLYQHLLTWYQTATSTRHKMMLTCALLMVRDGLLQKHNFGTHYNLDLVSHESD